MTRYSVPPGDGISVRGYGFLPFVTKYGQNNW